MADPTKIQIISIHAPREGSDAPAACSDQERTAHFYPRSP